MLKTRTLTALVIVPLGIAMVLLSPTQVLAAITGVLVLIAMWEWTRLAGFRAHPVRSAVMAIVALACVALWIVREEPAAWWVIGAGIAWWIVASAWLGNFSFGAAPTRENASIKLVAGLFATLPAWLALAKLHADSEQGPAWALFALALVWVADIAAYLAGSRYGKKKLCPNISPNKTTVGVYGAMAGAGVLAIICGLLFDLRGLHLVALIALALVTVAASIVGDLFESLIKRQAGVKDSGTLFPGHGGMFDRLDSVFAALPVFTAGKALLDFAFGP
jgi:phosphatidate cytidylyltransferase